MMLACTRLARRVSCLFGSVQGIAPFGTIPFRDISNAGKRMLKTPLDPLLEGIE